MDHLRCKTPEHVRNQLWVHLLCHNLIRRVMAVAAVESGRSPWEISFKGAMQTLEQFLPVMAQLRKRDEVYLCEVLFQAVASPQVGHCPDRYEPRLTKRRLKKYKHFCESRENYRTRLVNKR